MSPQMKLTIIPVCVLACLLGGCNFSSDGKSLSIWIASDMTALTDRTPKSNDPIIYDNTAGMVKLFSGANETVSFQIVVDAKENDIDKLSISCPDLSDGRNHSIDASNVRFFSAHTVNITSYPAWYLRLVDNVPQPAKFFDILVPLHDGGPTDIDLPTEGRAVIWVDVRIPPDAIEGTYNTTLTLSGSRGYRRTIKLKTQVYGFVLPDARPLATVGGFSSADIFRKFVKRNGRPFVPVRWDRKNAQVRRGLVLMRQLMRLSHAHRLDLFDKSIRPIMKRDAIGSIKIDWTDYDAIVMPYLDGSAFADRVSCPAWPMPLHNDWPIPKYYGGPHNDSYLRTITSLTKQYYSHFADILQVDRQMFHWPYRREINAAAYDTYAHLARLIKHADSATPVLSQLAIDPPKLTGWTAADDLPELIDIYSPAAKYFEPKPPTTARTDHPLAGTWLSPGDPPYLPSLGVIATGSDVRAIPWFAMRYKSAGMFIPDVLHWDKDPFSSHADADARLFYPGNVVGIDRILPSVRLKRLRRGLQDISYIWLLQQRNRAEIADRVLKAMARYGGLGAAGDHYLDPRLDGWQKDPQTWEMARRLLAEELQESMRNPTGKTTSRLLAQRILWQQFTKRSQQIRVEQVRSRVTISPDSAPTAKKLRATIWLDLYNEFSRDANATVKLDKLPPGWVAKIGEASVSPFRPATRKVVTLQLDGTYIAATSTGKVKLPIGIVTDMRDRNLLTAPIPFVMAGVVRKKLTIDGDLSDWPLRQGNTAGDFRLIGKRGSKGNGLAKRQTLAFVMRDKTNLYIAFHCAEPDMPNLTVQPDNAIRYRQLLACEEDLVEVLLDPGTKATTSEGLYHLTVKPNAVKRAEKGVSCKPPLGKSQFWPVEARIAVGTYTDHWIVEIALPLKSFGKDADARFWGINFSRFTPHQGESSNWAEAPRYLYDPRNLGTMYLPAMDKDKDAKPRQ